MPFCGRVGDCVMNRTEKLCTLSNILCGVENIADCPYRNGDECVKFGNCRIEEKTDEQLDYILSSINKCIYLEACAGSGKTEVLGMKAAYEICCWKPRDSGIAVLTFTNDATATILSRITTFYRRQLPSNHFVGTFSSFVHGYIAQRFGYKFYRNQINEKDQAFRIVDSEASQYSNRWLQNYTLDFPISNKTKIFANQLNYRFGAGEWFCGQGETSLRLRERYDSSETQQLITSLRNRIKKPHAFQYDYLCDKVVECKKKFWEAGFATFEDMNLIAGKCLKDAEICKYLVRKFPLILVDECQDLSQNELRILSFLIKAGAKVHYIGDLHQSIYSFKDASPVYFSKHINEHHFETMHLSDNFRSTQRIVDVSRNVIAISDPIIGRAQSKCNGDDCFYIEYSDEKDALPIFERLLAERGIMPTKAVVLTRTQAAKMKLSEGIVYDYTKHPIINAIQLWNDNSPSSRANALNLIGWQLQKWLGFQGRSNNFYFPSELCNDTVSWRLMLRDILVDFCGDKPIYNMDGVTYSAWYTSNKRQIVSIFNKHLFPVIGQTLDTTGGFIKAPKGTAGQRIKKITIDDTDNLKVETIHAVKGGTFDAVLLMSSQDARGKTGYWENWLNLDDEASRIGYVACTRPRFLLCWGVSSLTDEQRHKLEGLGLKKYTP